MSKHTPGPWFVTGQMTKYVEARISGGLIQEVAACGPTEADGGYGDQQRANANLIAAAPNLLEALESLLRVFEEVLADEWSEPRECWKRGGGWHGDWHDAGLDAIEAITKARGES